MKIVWLGIAILLASATATSAAPITVGGFTFSGGDAAFASNAFLVSGTIRFTCVTGGAEPATSVAGALAGHDLQRCINNNTGNSGIVEAVFLDSSIENAPGVDLIIFELSGTLPAGTADPRENFGVSIDLPTGSTPFSYFDPIATGLNSCGDPSLCLDIFVVQIDLSDFGAAPGSLVDRVRLHIFDVGLGAKSADIAALGAVHSLPSIPEPRTCLLLLAGLIGLRAMRRPDVPNRLDCAGGSIC